MFCHGIDTSIIVINASQFSIPSLELRGRPLQCSENCCRVNSLGTSHTSSGIVANGTLAQDHQSPFSLAPIDIRICVQQSSMVVLLPYELAKEMDVNQRPYIHQDSYCNHFKLQSQALLMPKRCIRAL